MRLTRLLALAALLLPRAAAAEADWFASLYTSEGVELRADERIFALYALLNAMGYDDAPLIRALPVPARDMTSVRLKVRAAIALDPTVAEKANAFFNAHPVSADAYARYVLTVKGPAGFERTPLSPGDLKGLEPLLAEAYTRLKLGDLFAAYQDEYRTALKGYHAVVDVPIQSVRKLLKMKEDDPPRVILVVNLLEGASRSLSATAGEDLYVVLGPSKNPDVFAVVREVARARIGPIVSAKASTIKALPDAASSAGESEPVPWSIELLSRAFAASALKMKEGEVEQVSKGSYAQVPELIKSIEAFTKSGQGLDAFVVEALSNLKAAEPQAKKPKK